MAQYRDDGQKTARDDIGKEKIRFEFHRNIQGEFHNQP